MRGPAITWHLQAFLSSPVSVPWNVLRGQNANVQRRAVHDADFKAKMWALHAMQHALLAKAAQLTPTTNARKARVAGELRLFTQAVTDVINDAVPKRYGRTPWSSLHARLDRLMESFHSETLKIIAQHLRG